MRILFVMDGRSPTCISWLRHWTETGQEIHLISTFPCERPEGLRSFNVIPAAFGRLGGRQSKKPGSSPSRPGWVRRTRNVLLALRYLLGPVSLIFYQRHFLNLVSEITPELVHAHRIPFEGMLAIVTPKKIPLVVSIWGNDLTLHAHGSFLMAAFTRRALARADGLIADTQRDIRMGRECGFKPKKTTLVVPGAGGIHLEELGKIPGEENLPEALPEGQIIVNARGQRPGSLRQDNFFQAIPTVLAKFPQAIFICPSLKGDFESETWVNALRINASVKLWPVLSQEQLWRLFWKAQIYVSPSVHDGTPNSLLEAMAYGCFPVVGDIESMREWIQGGVNGLLVDAARPEAIAKGIIQGIEQPEMRSAAAKFNAALIAERAAYEPNMRRVEQFYYDLRANFSIK